jgi:hypothetical protein
MDLHVCVKAFGMLIGITGSAALIPGNELCNKSTSQLHARGNQSLDPNLPNVDCVEPGW